MTKDGIRPIRLVFVAKAVKKQSSIKKALYDTHNMD